MSAVIYQISGGDKCLILDTRQAMIYPFTAPSWMDLRIGFYLSLCKTSNNADITGLAESLATVGQPSDRFWIGVKQNNNILPQTAGTTFIGWGRTSQPDNPGASALVSSDIGTGTTNSNYWRNGTATNSNSMWMNSGATFVGGGGSASAAPYIHFPQSVAGAGGNATLILMQLTRASGVATVVNVKAFATAAFSGDFQYDSVCSIANIRAAFRAATFAAILSGSDVVTVPDALYAYWPFVNSKLRIHAVCIEKFA